nr:hypothetical protein [Tanacetum cinerariifolium]
MSWLSRCSWCGCSFNGGNSRDCTNDSEDSLIIRNEELSTILEKESEEFIKSSVEDFVLISSESNDTSDGTNDDESLSNEDIPDNNVKIHSNPLFEFDDEYISSDVNPFLMRGDFDEINAFDIPSNFEDGYYDSDGDVLYLESLLSDDTTPHLPPEMFLDRDVRNLSNINDLKIMVKVFDPRILEKNFSPTYDFLDFEDSRARGFVHRLLELQSLAYGNPIS